MIGKKYTKMLLAGALALMLAGCAEESTVESPVETRAPVVLDPAVVAVEPQILPEATEGTAEKEVTIGQARERAETFGYFYGIKTDGSVVLREITERNAAGEYVPVENPGWTDIVAVVADTDAGVVGLKEDGTIVTTKPDSDDAMIMSAWQDVIEIQPYFSDVVGLCADGTVMTTMEDSPVNEWTDVIQVASSFLGIYGLKSDGTVIAEIPEMADVSDWTDVVQVAAGMYCVLGLRSDGTVLAASEYTDVQQHVADWTDIVAIDAYQEAIGLRSDGTVVCTDDIIGAFLEDMGETLDVSDWTDIVAIDTWGASFVGIRADGTLATAGMNEAGMLDVDHWQNIKAVKIDNYSTFALQEDGTLLMTGAEDELLWSDIRCPGE